MGGGGWIPVEEWRAPNGKEGSALRSNGNPLEVEERQTWRGGEVWPGGMGEGGGGEVVTRLSVPRAPTSTRDQGPKAYWPEPVTRCDERLKVMAAILDGGG